MVISVSQFDCLSVPIYVFISVSVWLVVFIMCACFCLNARLSVCLPVGDTESIYNQCTNKTHPKNSHVGFGFIHLKIVRQTTRRE